MILSQLKQYNEIYPPFDNSREYELISEIVDAYGYW